MNEVSQKNVQSKATTVVAVDDDPEVTALVKRILEPNGFQVHVANDGKTAVETLLRLRPGLVILDVVMPVLQGYDLCRYIRTRWELKNAKILFVSGLRAELDKRWAEEMGGNGYLTKPFKGDDLLRKVAELLGE